MMGAENQGTYLCAPGANTWSSSDFLAKKGELRQELTLKIDKPYISIQFYLFYLSIDFMNIIGGHRISLPNRAVGRGALDVQS
jgi:hypothetical protein